ncbi:hypothetical protein POVCU2_0032550 [Plasmodium ovale curtisi]|uniref:Uncharacterized protein n=1 Tax=Plasmodium ovale curtisi TaxID=864141 RepID=A0A1A8W3B5_PLAOA|nr:hypothetical protein POVCU2_0032550 [Plasmodium ovale curtisi]SBT02184.1 hypothetical protein POVCU1_073990 [Plasmodium ovale curtisi]
MVIRLSQSNGEMEEGKKKAKGDKMEKENSKYEHNRQQTLSVQRIEWGGSKRRKAPNLCKTWKKFVAAVHSRHDVEVPLAAFLYAFSKE